MGLKEMIESGRTCIGIEFGSTNIKAVLTGENNEVLASGSYGWVSSFENGYFTYSLEEVRNGLQVAYGRLKADIREKYGAVLKKTGCIGISAMMHGYLAFDEKDELLVPFRTWQNTTTTKAAEELSGLFKFNIPERWSVAHLYQAVLDNEPHIAKIARINTLAGYVHYLLTGQFVIGIGDASGMFPVDSSKMCYDEKMMELLNSKIAEKELPWKPADVFPVIKLAGEKAGTLTEEGAAILDPEGDLEEGILFCPPEGDAGTGMTATNSIAENTGNVSAGTSIFAMVVLDKALADYYKEIDMVATPDGKPVAMVHCNNCTNDMNAWAGVLGDFLTAVQQDGEQTQCADAGKAYDPGAVYRTIYKKAREADADCGGTVVCNYIAGEPVTGISEGHPLVSRDPGKPFKFANLCRAILYSSVVSLKIGMDVLKKENISIASLTGHGGLFKNGDFAAVIMASAIGTKVNVMETAEVGGPYGMALLAGYCCECAQKDPGAVKETLQEFLNNKVFKDVKIHTSVPCPETGAGFEVYTDNFRKMLQMIR